jgi:hypothetical protein
LKKAIALSALPLAFLFVTAFQSSNSVVGQLAALQAQVASIAANNKGPRNFYLTKTEHIGSQALSACATGYHMASLWEIHDPTELRYNTDLGFTRDDSGLGPPTNALGWIRTGYQADTVLPGNANCNAWTSDSGTHNGTSVRLHDDWAIAGDNITPWRVSVGGSCANGRPVWCVQD